MIQQPNAFSRVFINDEPGSSNGDLLDHRQVRRLESPAREGYADYFLMDKNGGV